MGVKINYKGQEISDMSASGTKTLLTSGKYCEDNIEIVYTGGSTIQTCKNFVATISSDSTAKTILTSADSDIASHRSDSTFFVAVIAMFPYSSGLSFRGGFNTNTNLRQTDTLYGSFARTNSSGQNGVVYITKTATTSSADIGVKTNGEIFVYATTSNPLRAGSYMCVCGW